MTPPTSLTLALWATNLTTPLNGLGAWAAHVEAKMAEAAAAGAKLLVTECPGCLMQLRGGVEKKGLKIEVKHIAEALVERK